MDVESHRDEIISLALSDEVPFDIIRERFGLDETDLKGRMRAWLKPGSYRAWRERVQAFRARHPGYKKTDTRKARRDAGQTRY